MGNDTVGVGYIDIIARMDGLEASILSKMGVVGNNGGSTFASSFKTAIAPLGGYIASVLSVTAATQFGKSIFTLASQVQQAKIAFDKLTGSQEVSLKLLNDIKTFAKTTPFDQMGLVDGAKRLLAYGFQAQQIIPIMNSLGNAVSAVGGGQDTLNGVIVALGQMQTKGRLVQQEVNQIAERGIPIFDILKEKLGLTDKQLGDIGNQGISASKAIPLILQGIQERYNGIMDEQALTLLGRRSNMMDVVKITMADIGLSSADGMGEAISNITAFISDNHDVILSFVTDVTDSIGDMAVTAGDIIGGVVGEIKEVADEGASAIQDMNATVTGDTEQTISGLKGDWSDRLYYIKLGLDGILGIINLASNLIISTVSGVFKFMQIGGNATAELLVGSFQFAFTAISSFFSVLSSKIVGGFALIANELINSVNRATGKLNKILPGTIKLGEIGNIDYKSKSWSSVGGDSDLLKKGAVHFKLAWRNSFDQVGDAWDKTSDKIANNMENTYLKRVKSIKDQETKDFIKFERDKVKADLETLNAKIKNGQDLTKAEKAEYDKKKSYLDDLNKSLNGAFDDKKIGSGGSGSGTSEKAKQVIQDYKDINKAIEDSGKKLLGYQEDIDNVKDKFTELKDGAIKDISDINLSMAELGKKTDEKLGTRFADVSKTISDIEVSMKSAGKNPALFDGYNLGTLEQVRKGGTSEINGFDIDKVIEYKKAQQELADLMANTTKEVRDQALAYSELNETQRILKEKQDELLVLQEKRSIAEAFSSQKSLDNNALQIQQTGDSIKAFYEDEAGKLVEIKDMKNIQYAQDLIDKQNKLSQEMDILKGAREIEEGQYSLLMQSKISYEQNYTKVLRSEINSQKSFVDELIGKYRELNAERSRGSDSSAGRRAYGGNVNRGQVYITGENHHNELFTPYTSGFIAPSYDNSKNINVDIGTITSNSPQDFGERLRQNLGNYL